MTELSNYMEKLVFNKYDEVKRSRPELCDCEQCKLDICAIALNNLAPRYIVSNKGEIFTKLDMMETQFGIDVLMAIGKAIAIVSENPRHQSKE